MRKILEWAAGLAVVGALMALMWAGTGLVLADPTPTPAPAMHRYKVVVGDDISIVEGTRMTVDGVFVCIWVGETLDTVVTAPRYVTELPPDEPEAKPAVEPVPDTRM